MDAISIPKYPAVEVQLTGTDGNAFSILAAVAKALRSHGMGEPEVKAFYKEAMAGDYDNLLQTVMRWVEVS